MFKTISQLLLAFVITASLFFPLSTIAQPAANQEAQQINLGVREIKPFIIKDGEGYTGFSADLWKEIAKRANLNTVQYKLYPNVGDFITGVQSNEVNAGIAAISITADRETKIDFTQPMFNSGLKILVQQNNGGGEGSENLFTKMYSALKTKEFTWLVGTTLLLALIPAHLMYFIEGTRQRGLFSRSYFPGIFEALGWTLTALGMGMEESPKTRTGRVLGIIWMFAGIIFIAFFTATVTSDLTAQKLQGGINSIDDLAGKRVVTVKNSTASKYLTTSNISYTSAESPDEAYKALTDDTADAVVYDAPALEYFESHDGKGKVKTVGEIFKPENYGIALPKDSVLRDKVDQALLSIQEDGTYATIRAKWFEK